MFTFVVVLALVTLGAAFVLILVCHARGGAAGTD
jgi:hypothetical protein